MKSARPPQAIDPEQMRQAVHNACQLLKSLANVDRLMLVCQLTHGEKCVSELEEALGIGQPTLSQQLGVLRDNALVLTRREGKNIYYRMANPRALALVGTLYDQYCCTRQGPTSS